MDQSSYKHCDYYIGQQFFIVCNTLFKKFFEIYLRIVSFVLSVSTTRAWFKDYFTYVLAFCVKMLGAEFLGVCFKKYSSLNFEKIREIIKIKITKNNTYIRLNFKPKVTKSMVKMIGFIRGEVKDKPSTR